MIVKLKMQTEDGATWVATRSIPGSLIQTGVIIKEKYFDFRLDQIIINYDPYEVTCVSRWYSATVEDMTKSISQGWKEV